MSRGNIWANIIELPALYIGIDMKVGNKKLLYRGANASGLSMFEVINKHHCPYGVCVFCCLTSLLFNCNMSCLVYAYLADNSLKHKFKISLSNFIYKVLLAKRSAVCLSFIHSHIHSYTCASELPSRCRSDHWEQTHT